MQMIETDKAPKAIGPYSQGIIYEGIIFLSGQIAIDPKTQKFINGDIKQQTKQVMENIKGILEELNLDFDHVIKTTIYLKNIDDFPVVNEIYGSYFDEYKPARSTVEVSNLPKGALIEIEAIVGK
jgi:2-iminobutanoate/2-iminopropanoate deaminase